MKKNGFVFVETIVVLVTLVVGMVGLYTFYNSISVNIDKREFFDNISDLYKVNIVRDYVDKNSVTGIGLVKLTSSNFYDYTKFDTLKEELNIEEIYVNKACIDTILTGTNIRPNSLREYLKTIRSEDCLNYNSYLIVHFNYNDNNYYASLKL